jgi:peptidoglycan/LPS O-acetylase OafA/YrhL
MRIKGLDFLRAIAILLVLFRHSGLDNFLAHAGWAGVDLFFVLSGFLVSSLLFNEYNKTHSVDITRFLIRRGFKIYPAFYIFLATTICYLGFFKHQWVEKSKIISEVFFVQNYFPAINYHTWSLAVEEHFYILLSLLFLIFVRFHFIEKRKVLLINIISVVLIVTTLRLQFTLKNYDSDFLALFCTHHRIDGLFVGFLVSLICHHYNATVNFVKKYVWIFAILAAILISPLFIFTGGGHFMNIAGTNIMQLGFGLMLLIVVTFPYTVTIPTLLNPIYKTFCYIGLYSYSIYLWHVFVLDQINAHFPSNIITTLSFFVLSILVGIVTALLIENPFLKLRDRLFPKRQGSAISVE